jgi:hypothetical protein
VAAVEEREESKQAEPRADHRGIVSGSALKGQARPPDGALAKDR